MKEGGKEEKSLNMYRHLGYHWRTDRRECMDKADFRPAGSHPVADGWSQARGRRYIEW